MNWGCSELIRYPFKAEGQAILEKIVADSDVFIENYIPKKVIWVLIILNSPSKNLSDIIIYMLSFMRLNKISNILFLCIVVM